MTHHDRVLDRALQVFLTSMGGEASYFGNSLGGLDSRVKHGVRRAGQGTETWAKEPGSLRRAPAACFGEDHYQYSAIKRSNFDKKDSIFLQHASIPSAGLWATARGGQTRLESCPAVQRRSIYSCLLL